MAHCTSLLLFRLCILKLKVIGQGDTSSAYSIIESVGFNKTLCALSAEVWKEGYNMSSCTLIIRKMYIIRYTQYHIFYCYTGFVVHFKYSLVYTVHFAEELGH